MRLIRRAYDKAYYENALAAKPPRSQRDQVRLGLVRERVPHGTLLEIGCGKGGFIRAADKCFQVHGIDVSEYAVRHSRRISGAHVVRGDVERMRFSTKRFDVVAAFGLLEHLAHPEAVIHRIYEMLSPGGLFVGSVPNNWGPLGKIATAIMDLVDRTHCSSYPPNEWRALFEGAGFGQIAFLGEFAPTKGSCILVRHALWPYLSPNLMFLCSK